MTIPDFFIVGGPKCGTNALYSYLADHPRIYVPSLKEPHFFCSDLKGLLQVGDFDEYKSLYAYAPQDKLKGDGSVWHLYSDVAIKNIMAANPDAKVITMLRNPIDMAYSLHSQFLRSLKEDVDDFAEAWQLQAKRRRGERLPFYSPEPKCLQYRDVCSFGYQIQRMQQVVPERQRKIIIFEEFVQQPGVVYKDVLDFLELRCDDRQHFPKVNENAAFRSHLLMKILRNPPKPLGATYQFIKRVSNLAGIKPLDLVAKVNFRPASRLSLEASFRRVLAVEFAQDKLVLEELLGRRLSCWDEDFGMANTALAG